MWVNSDAVNSGNSLMTFDTDKELFLWALGRSSQKFTINMGQKEFEYSIPSGYKAPTSENLPAPTFDPDGVTQDKPSNHFKAVTYQGNGGQQGDDYGWIEGSRAAVFNGSSSKITITELDNVGAISCYYSH